MWLWWILSVGPALAASYTSKQSWQSDLRTSFGYVSSYNIGFATSCTIFASLSTRIKMHTYKSLATWNSKDDFKRNSPNVAMIDCWLWLNRLVNVWTKRILKCTQRRQILATNCSCVDSLFNESASIMLTLSWCYGFQPLFFTAVNSADLASRKKKA